MLYYLKSKQFLNIFIKYNNQIKLMNIIILLFKKNKKKEF